jgi:hypothetical protein
MRFKAVIKIDLPGFMIYDSLGKIARFFGRGKRSTGEMRLLADTFTLIDQFISGFKSMGITNAIALKIDHKMIYNDTKDREDDVEQLVAALDQHQYILDETFEHLQLAMECRRDGIHYVFDTQVKGKEKVGKEEVAIAVSGKPVEFNKKKGETPEKYRNRFKRLIGDQNLIESYEIQFKHFLEDVVQKLKIYLNAISAKIDYWETPGKPAGRMIPKRKTHPRVSENFSGSGGERHSEQIVKEIIRGKGSTKQITKVMVTKNASRSLSKKTLLEEDFFGSEEIILLPSQEIDLLDHLLQDIGDESLEIEKLFVLDPRRKEK